MGRALFELIAIIPAFRHNQSVGYVRTLIFDLQNTYHALDIYYINSNIIIKLILTDVNYKAVLSHYSPLIVLDLVVEKDLDIPNISSSCFSIEAEAQIRPRPIQFK